LPEGDAEDRRTEAEDAAGRERASFDGLIGHPAMKEGTIARASASSPAIAGARRSGSPAARASSSISW